MSKLLNNRTTLVEEESIASDILKTESANYEEKLALIRENLLAVEKDCMDEIYGCTIYELESFLDETINQTN